MPPDNSAQVESMKEAEAARQQQIQDAKDAQTKADLAALRGSSATAGRASAQDFFAQQGLDPSEYQSSIDARIASTLAGISPTDPNPGASFSGIGQQIYDADTAAAQAKAGRGIDALFSPNYGASKAPFSIMDPYVAGIDATQRSAADAIIQNMLSRGVITPAGQTSAEAELTRQDPGVLATIRSAGTGLVSSEQQALDDIANKGRTSAQTLKLGTRFDPNTFGTQADQNFSDFMRDFNTSLQGKIGSANLFNTQGLAAIAGAGQGAQNLPFDPTAQAGVIDPNAQATNKTTPTTSAVF
jgi:hypothetical protein